MSGFTCGPLRVLPAVAAALCLLGLPRAAPAPRDSSSVPPRGYRTFLPKQGETADEAANQLVQVLLDRQDKGEFDSYMVQVLFRGKPPERVLRRFDDRVEIDFLDTGKPSMRLARIRGGAVEASSLEEYFYRLPPKPAPEGAARAPGRIKHLVRLTLYMRAKPELRFRDTLDRTLIHFRVEKQAAPTQKTASD